MGAKLICTLNEQGIIQKKEEEKMMSFCSVSGPMFIIGTVGVNIFLSYKAGLIILVANIIAALINGLIYRKDKYVEKEVSYSGKKNDNILSSSVYDATLSILMVCAYIVISFLIIDVLIIIVLTVSHFDKKLKKADQTFITISFFKILHIFYSSAQRLYDMS